MSRIFDALQRAVVERDGGTTAAPSQATELLERAERQAVLAWKSLQSSQAVEPDTSAAVAVAELETEEVAGRAGVVAAESTTVAAKSASAPALKQFASLSIASPTSQLAFIADSDGPGAEAFRLFAVRLRALRHERALKKVLITSTTPREGKSVVSANIACALASATHERVLLIEGDIRRPTLSQIFGIGARPGLCDYLNSERTLAESAYKLESAGIWLMPAGTAPVKSMDVLRSSLLPEMMNDLSEIFDTIVIDSPPVLPLADASIWIRMADGVLLIARQGVSEKRKLEKGLQGIDPRKLIGAVLNSSTSMQESSYSYYRRDVE